MAIESIESPTLDLKWSLTLRVVAIASLCFLPLIIYHKPLPTVSWRQIPSILFLGFSIVLLFNFLFF